MPEDDLGILIDRVPGDAQSLADLLVAVALQQAGEDGLHGAEDWKKIRDSQDGSVRKQPKSADFGYYRPRSSWGASDSGMAS